MRAKKKWYEDWGYELKSADSYGICHMKITLPNSTTEQKVFRVSCSPDSEVRRLVMLLECALMELNTHDGESK